MRQQIDELRKQGLTQGRREELTMIPDSIAVFMIALALLVVFETGWSVVPRRWHLAGYKAAAFILYWSGVLNLTCTCNVMPPTTGASDAAALTTVVVLGHAVVTVIADSRPYLTS